MAVYSSPPPSSNPMSVSCRVQYESYYNFSGESVQGIISPFYCVNCSNQTGAPNAVRWHSPPVFPPQSITMRTEMSSVCSLSSSTTSVQKVCTEMPCTTHTDHANISHKLEFIAGLRRSR
jgi:hypothetical protein